MTAGIQPNTVLYSSFLFRVFFFLCCCLSSVYVLFYSHCNFDMIIMTLLRWPIHIYVYSKAEHSVSHYLSTKHHTAYLPPNNFRRYFALGKLKRNEICIILSAFFPRLNWTWSSIGEFTVRIYLNMQLETWNMTHTNKKSTPANIRGVVAAHNNKYEFANVHSANKCCELEFMRTHKLTASERILPHMRFNQKKKSSHSHSLTIELTYAYTFWKPNSATDAHKAHLEREKNESSGVHSAHRCALLAPITYTEQNRLTKEWPEMNKQNGLQRRRKKMRNSPKSFSI